MNIHQISSSGTGVPPALLAGETPETMTSLQMAEVVDKRHDNVRRTIESLSEQGIIQLPQSEEVTNHLSQKVKIYRLGERDSYVVVARLSPEFTARLVDFWQKHKKPSFRVPTTAEAFASAFQMIADTERRQADQQRAIEALESKVGRVEMAQTVMRSRPANTEGITHIRARIGRMFGVSASIIDEVMRQSPYTPKPAGMVQNDHVDAGGSVYAVYWQKDITDTFRRFVGECVQVTACLYTHPFIEGRFRIAAREVVA